MSLESNTNLGNWLAELNGKTVDQVFQVDFNNYRNEDDYLPWLFLITFYDLNKFLEIQGDFDGEHIGMVLRDISGLDQKLKDNDLSDYPDLWRVYETSLDETIGKILGKQIKFVEYGIDKAVLDLIGTTVSEQQPIYYFLRLYFEATVLTIFEGHATGLGVSDDPYVQLNLEEYCEVFVAK